MKIGQPIRMEDCPLLGELHRNKKNTPTMGGILILFSMLVSMFLWMDLKNVFTLILFLTTLFLGCIGGYDGSLKLKYKNTAGLSAKKKLFFQFLFSFFVALYLLSPQVTDVLHIGRWFSPPVIKELVKHSVESANAPVMQNSLSLDDYASRLYLPFLKIPS